MSWTRDGCMSNVAQSVGAWRTAAVAMQRRAPNDLSAFAACQLQTSSCGAFTFKGRDGAGCCCSWRTRPASGSLPRPAESGRFAWWVHPGALGSRTSGWRHGAQILDKEALAYRRDAPWLVRTRNSRLISPSSARRCGRAARQTEPHCPATRQLTASCPGRQIKGRQAALVGFAILMLLFGCKAVLVR